MALMGRKSSCHIRSTNKEPEWSSLCENVFDQYLDDDDIFSFDGPGHERTSSDDSRNLFDFSGSSEQSNQTSMTSPIPVWSEAASFGSADTEAKQPRGRAPADFWAKKLRALEQNAAEYETPQQKLRTAQSHPDFLSLGAFPSPPALPVSLTSQSFSAQRQRSRMAANGRKTPTQRNVINSRSVSRGRPSGVMKPPATAAAAVVNPYATIRRSNASPPKMMDPSRYRAAFQDVRAERIEHSPKKYELRLSSLTFPDSPPPSGRLTQDAFAASESPFVYDPISGHDDQISPLANSFQRAAHIQTPTASPLRSPGSHATLSYFSPPPPFPSKPFTAQTVPLNDTAPLYPGSDNLAANKIQTFNFGFSSSPVDDTWSDAPFTEQLPASAFAGDTLDESDTFSGLDALTSTTATNTNLGLGINCDPTKLPSSNSTIVPTATYQHPPISTASPFYVTSLPHGLPIHPIRSTPSRRRSPSPAAPVSGSPSRPTSSSRRASRHASRHHRRAKSTTPATPRPPAQNAKEAGFVNFTPQDSSKILSGVAPSGSSKTKARREKEAADRRRRLSQAAMRAVMEAGGDVESLQKAGLIMG